MTAKLNGPHPWARKFQKGYPINRLFLTLFVQNTWKEEAVLTFGDLVGMGKELQLHYGVMHKSFTR